MAATSRPSSARPRREPLGARRCARSWAPPDDKKRGDEASTALADVVDGLRAHDAAPVLIAVDEYSALRARDGLYCDGVSLKPDDLVHIRALRALEMPASRPGASARGADALLADRSRAGAGSGRDDPLGIAHAPFEIPVGMPGRRVRRRVHRYVAGRRRDDVAASARDARVLRAALRGWR